MKGRERYTQIAKLISQFKYDADGNVINCEMRTKTWSDWIRDYKPYFDSVFEHRIIPEPTYVPYDMEETLIGLKIRHIESGTLYVITQQNVSGVYLGPWISLISYENLLKFYVFINGNPCGVKR
ncbi:MAG: hypothetical protein HGB12_14100 [Bacteroidetes bacterium]|nr:hypothetical protein [Bacteroidota bacterium]